ncbi:ABC transporter permease [Micromonospora sp. CNB394]|uniref:ABC transporter permease n=1 Tax=Micromonospora sp. CNB394 TaxID=1169151 RepID=UPI0003622BCB|nr:ABC transporter permease [Micromonospora sp. CNB394]
MRTLARSGDAAEVGADPASWRGTGAFTQLRVLTARQLAVVYGDRRIALFTVLQPIIMLMLFSQVFGSMADPASFPGGVRYVDYLIPALLVTTGIGSAQGAGLGLVREMESGMVARFRFLPVSPPLVLVARSLTDLVRVLGQLLTLLACGWVVLRFEPTGGLAGLGAAVVLALLMSWSLMWVFIALATWLRSIEVLSSVGFLVTFPLMFASSAFVPLDALPGWLQLVAAFNPVTYAVEAARHLALGWSAGGTVLAALATSLGLAVCAALVAVRGYRRPPNERRGG